MTRWEVRIKEGDPHVTAVEVNAKTFIDAAEHVANLIWRDKGHFSKVYVVATGEDRRGGKVTMLFEVCARANPFVASKQVGVVLIREVK